MDVALALWGGIIGAIMMATVYAGFLGLQLTRLDLLAFEGGLLTRDRGMVHLVGGILQVVLGALAALGYRWLFQRIDSATYVGWGALLGLAHGLLVVLLLPLLGLVNQRVRAGEVPRPGLAGREYGGFTPIALLVAFAVFGVWIGVFLLP